MPRGNGGGDGVGCIQSLVLIIHSGNGESLLLGDVSNTRRTRHLDHRPPTMANEKGKVNVKRVKEGWGIDGSEC